MQRHPQKHAQESAHWGYYGIEIVGQVLLWINNHVSGKWKADDPFGIANT